MNNKIILSDYNREAFTEEEVQEGQFNNLLNYLLEYNKKTEKSYYDIHIFSDGYCMVIEWIRRDYDDETYGKFEFVDNDQIVMTEKTLPDNSTVYVVDEDEYKSIQEDWLKEHSSWKQNEFGRWYDEEEYSDLKKELSIKNENN